MDIALFHWLTHKSLFNGFNNPLYLPQLLYRTPLVMVLGGCFGLFLSAVFTKKGEELRIKAFRYISKWMLFWLPFAIIGSIYYYKFDRFLCPDFGYQER